MNRNHIDQLFLFSEDMNIDNLDQLFPAFLERRSVKYQRWRLSGSMTRQDTMVQNDNTEIRLIISIQIDHKLQAVSHHSKSQNYF